VTVVDVYPDVTIRAASLEIPLPSVIALNEYVPKSRHTPAFTRRNVFLRDEYKCQYCRERFHTNDLSLDHVVPRCKGGVLSWYVVATMSRICSKKTKPMDSLFTTYTVIVLLYYIIFVRTNAVTSCLKCNGRKGSMSVYQLRSIGMKLYREPRVPSHFDLASHAGRMVPRRVDPTWKPFLGLPAEEEEEGRTPVVGQDEED
jgi:5-methylcytosine-specific restriction endonuclease McrA